MISSTTINNPRTKRRNKIITCLIGGVGGNNRDLIRSIATRFWSVVKELTMFDTAQE